ncbi:MAG: trypsin-like peptidase domain-containing protein [Pirellulales bacterium]|nr:trypsin-like peptidase domain-containing protein [Pirellulales bacterium]
MALLLRRPAPWEPPTDAPPRPRRTMQDESNLAATSPTAGAVDLPIPAPVRAPAVDPRRSAIDDGEDAARLRRLLTLFFALAAVLIAPSLAGQVQYALTSAKERAKYDVAREHLGELELSQLSFACRMVSNKVAPSVVSIRTSHRHVDGQGSGVIVDKHGYIVTNQHVVDGVDTVEVQLSDGRRGSATVVGVDGLIDVALLKTELSDLTPAEWGDSDEIEVGDLVWAVGSPFGLEKSTTFGILSQKGRHGITDPSRVVQEFLQTDAAVNPGNSGGPLVNIRGEVVGINTAIVGAAYQGISFAIPSAQVRDSYEQLREKGRVDRGFLGVRLEAVPDYVARRLGLELNQGVFVRTVNPNTPASMGGMEPGDVVVAWDGQEFSDPVTLSQMIAATPAGSDVPVKVLRLDGREPRGIDLKVKVAARPTN